MEHDYVPLNTPIFCKLTILVYTSIVSSSAGFAANAGAFRRPLNITDENITNMDRVSSQRKKGQSPLDDDATWLEIFEPIFLEDAQLAEKMAGLWQLLISEIERGEEGATHARHCLERAIRLAFPYTKAFRICRDQFEASLVEVLER